MTLALRIVLILAALIMLIFIVRKVRDSKVRLEDSLFWVCFAIIVLVLSVFPQILSALSKVAGTMAPVNFVFLLFIFILLIQSFNLSMRASKTDTKLRELTQQLAIEKFERYCGEHDMSLSVEAAQFDDTPGADRRSDDD